MGEHAAVLCFGLLYQMKKSVACKKKNVCTLPMVKQKGEVVPRRVAAMEDWRRARNISTLCSWCNTPPTANAWIRRALRPCRMMSTRDWWEADHRICQISRVDRQQGLGEQYCSSFLFCAWSTTPTVIAVALADDTLTWVSEKKIQARRTHLRWATEQSSFLKKLWTK